MENREFSPEALIESVPQDFYPDVVRWRFLGCGGNIALILSRLNEVTRVGMNTDTLTDLAIER